VLSPHVSANGSWSSETIQPTRLPGREFDWRDSSGRIATLDYARFYKADLHMQTPVDGVHWLGQAMPDRPTPADRMAAAEAYVRRCYETGVEIIAITEHNFGRSVAESLIPEIEAAAQRLSAEYGYELAVFPGFEVTAPIGRGAHMICIFERGTALGTVDAKLTELGLPPNRRFGDNRAPLPVRTADATFERILHVIQDDDSVPGICFGAHPNNSGVLDRANIEQWWSQEVIRNDHFLCMELPHSRDDYVNGPQTLTRSIVLNSDERYRRRHAIATICNSDAKQLTSTTERPTNFIGFRHSWLKMSDVTVEGLRQAFIDHESRIRFGDARPEDAFTYPRILSMSVRRAAFLGDQDLSFAPNMTALIGGGGTGKSTLIEYLRLVLGQADAIEGAESRSNFEKLRKTIRDDTLVEVRVERDGATWTLRNESNRAGTVVEGEAVPDFPKFFPVRFFSQREIYAIAESREARAQLLDNLVSDRLEELRRTEDDIIARLRQLNLRVSNRPTIEKRLRELQTEELDVRKRLESLNALAEPLAQWRSTLETQRELAELQQAAAELAAALREAAGVTRIDAIEPVSEEDVITRFRARALDAERALQRAVRDATETFEQALAAAEAEEVAAWRLEYERREREYEELRATLEEQGTDPGQYLEYEELARERQTEIADTEQTLADLDAAAIDRRDALAELRQAWRLQQEVRQEKAAFLEQAVPRTSADTPFVTVAVEPFGDDEAFKASMEPYARDRRRITDEDWRGLLDAVVGATQDGESPATLFAGWIDQLRNSVRPDGYPWDVADRRSEVLVEWCTPASCADIELIRVPDKLVVRLYRDDGSVAGDLETGLSVGQKSTAILTLLLVDDDAPAVIDQPEDELDNEFTYRQLVPLLRAVKERRQVILSTHDPNLPVNGDAELIYALQARDGRGVRMEVDGVDAVGALDRLPVRKAVEEVMEGSEEAFRRRYEKYGF